VVGTSVVSAAVLVSDGVGAVSSSQRARGGGRTDPGYRGGVIAVASLVAWVLVGPVQGAGQGCAATPLIAETEQQHPADLDEVPDPRRRADAVLAEPQNR